MMFYAFAAIFMASIGPAAPLVVPSSASSKVLDLLDASSGASSRGRTFSPVETGKLRSLVEDLERDNAPVDSMDVDGAWTLLATLSPKSKESVETEESAVSFWSLQSWSSYFAGNGPSPLQSLVTGATSVGGVTQILTQSCFENVVDFGIFGFVKGNLVLRAARESEGSSNNKIQFRFRSFGSRFLLDTIWGGTVAIPYPIPFDLLGKKAIGWLDTVAFDEATGVRIAKGNRGTTFIFKKDPEYSCERLDFANAYDSLAEKGISNCGEGRDDLTKRPVVLLPAQFSSAEDYAQLIKDLNELGHPVFPVSLTWLDWLSITKSLPTMDYFKGELKPTPTLNFYLDKISSQVEKIGGDKDYAILSHSMGGWVGRAWLQRADDSERCKAFVSLGTPHHPAEEGSVAASLDQTRGLLSSVNEGGDNFSSTSYTSVVSKDVKGKSAKNLQNVLAFLSYFSLSGKGDEGGDGITPISVGVLRGSKEICLSDGGPYHHMDFIPSPAPGRNIRLLGTKWLGSQLESWGDALSD